MNKFIKLLRNHLIIFWGAICNVLSVPLAWIHSASINVCTIWFWFKNEIMTNSKFLRKSWFQSNLRIGNGSVGFVQNSDSSGRVGPCSISACLSFHQSRLSSSMQVGLNICNLKIHLGGGGCNRKMFCLIFLLAPTGALIVIVVYWRSARQQPLFEILSISDRNFLPIYIDLRCSMMIYDVSWHLSLVWGWVGLSLSLNIIIYIYRWQIYTWWEYDCVIFPPFIIMKYSH